MLRIVIVSFLLASLAGCGGGERQPAEKPGVKAAIDKKPEPAPVKVAATGGWGTVMGRITWGGDVVPPRPQLDLKMHADTAACEEDG